MKFRWNLPNFYEKINIFGLHFLECLLTLIYVKLANGGCSINDANNRKLFDVHR